MMRRGPLADFPIDTLLDAAADERLSGVIEVRSSISGSVYLVDGDLYLAELEGQPPLEERLVAAGVLTREQVDRYTEPGEEGAYLALALDTDESIDEHRIDAYLLDVTASALAHFAAAREGEYELDPYRTHPTGILASWSPGQVFERVRELQEEAARVEAERAEAARTETEADEAQHTSPDHDTDSADGQLDNAPADSGPSGDVSTAIPAQAEDREPESSGTTEIPDTPDEAPPTPPAVEPVMLVVTHDEPPSGVDPIELRPIEWRVVVMAAQGISLGDLAVRLALGGDEVRELVDQLVDRGLLAAAG